LVYRLLVLLLTALLTSPSNSAEADLSWTPPIQNTDGTPLVDLTSYDIWHGCQQSGAYDVVSTVLAPAASHTVQNLPDSGTCYFAVKAVNLLGETSVFSNEAVKFIGVLQLPGALTDTAITWAESQALIIDNTIPDTYEWGVVAIDELVYTDRSFVFTDLPSELVGLDYLRTANVDKASTSDNAVSFDVSRPVTVFVAHDVRITDKPAWLLSWTNTPIMVTTNDASFGIFFKDFQVGQVILGGNNGPRQSSMYSIMVK